MKRIFILLLLTVFSGMALALSAPVLLNATEPQVTSTRQPIRAFTATPDDIKPTPIPLEMQAGHSDGVVAIAILIVAIIIVPMLLKRAEWRGN